ncbi:MAG: hypothetical protein NT167_30745, partial [Verrucomicrobia bacterium]|nr:hypothetical protein [Verrucomicrobiota bacterium]
MRKTKQEGLFLLISAEYAICVPFALVSEFQVYISHSLRSYTHQFRQQAFSLSAGVQNETCCGDKMSLAQSENFAGISG